MTTDTALEQRLFNLYAVRVPVELDRRVVGSMSTLPVHQSRRTRPRVIVALAVAATLAAGAAGPALEWFGGRDDPFEPLWEVATPVEQSVTADGYRVTVHRAYADRLGVRLAMTVQDLKDRWSGLEVDAAEMTDSSGQDYEAWNSSLSRTPMDGAIAQWTRFVLPDDVRAEDRQVKVTVTSLRVRSPDPIPRDLDPEQIWTSVGGAWSFKFDMPPITQGRAVSPAATVNAHDVTITLEQLQVVPSGTVARLAVEGLPVLPGSAYGWLPSTTIAHDGQPLSDQPFEPGILRSDGVVVIEALPDVEGAIQPTELEGHWSIKVDEFYAFDSAVGRGVTIQGPWVLVFDVAKAP